MSAAACVPQESRPPQKLLQTGMTRVRKEGGEGEGAGGQTLTAGCAHVILGAELLHQEQGCSPPPSLCSGEAVTQSANGHKYYMVSWTSRLAAGQLPILHRRRRL